MKINVKDSQLRIGVAGGAPATVIAQIKDGTVDLGEVSMSDATSTTDATNVMVPGIRESMEGQFTLQWDPALATHITLMTNYLAKTLMAIGFDVRSNAPASIVAYHGDAFIINMSAPLAVQGGNGVMESTLKFKLSGKYTKVVPA